MKFFTRFCVFATLCTIIYFNTSHNLYRKDQCLIRGLSLSFLSKTKWSQKHDQPGYKDPLAFFCLIFGNFRVSCEITRSRTKNLQVSISCGLADLSHGQGNITYYTRPLSMTCFQSLLKLFIFFKVLQINIILQRVRS